MTDRSQEWRDAWWTAEKEKIPVRNELGETLSECEARFIREYGIDAERQVYVQLLRWNGVDIHLEAFYRTIIRLVRIDHG